MSISLYYKAFFVAIWNYLAIRTKLTMLDPSHSGYRVILEFHKMIVVFYVSLLLSVPVTLFAFAYDSVDKWWNRT